MLLMNYGLNMCGVARDDFVVVENRSNIVLSEVLQIICDNIKEDELEKLATLIGITKDYVEKIDIKSESTASKMMKCFEKERNSITWKFLKAQLQKINRFDIIEMIKNETLPTTGKCLVLLMLII